MSTTTCTPNHGDVGPPNRFEVISRANEHGTRPASWQLGYCNQGSHSSGVQDHEWQSGPNDLQSATPRIGIPHSRLSLDGNQHARHGTENAIGYSTPKSPWHWPASWHTGYESRNTEPTFVAELTSTTPQRGPTSGPTGNASTGYRPRIVEHGQLRQGIQVAGSTHPTPNAIDGGQDGWQELWNTNSLALQVASKLGYRDHGPALKYGQYGPITQEGQSAQQAIHNGPHHGKGTWAARSWTCTQGGLQPTTNTSRIQPWTAPNATG